MRWDCHRTPQNGGSAPATPGFNAVAPEWLTNYGAAAVAAPAVPAAESTLGSHPCVALSSAQVLPEWINRNLAVHAFTVNGDNPLNFVSHSRGSLQAVFFALALPFRLERATSAVVRYPPQSGWLDEFGGLKGGWSMGLGVARCAPYGSARIVRPLHPSRLVRGWMCGPAPIRTRRLTPRNRGPRSARP